MVPAVAGKLKANRKSRLLYFLGFGFIGFSLGVVIDDVKVGIKNFSAWDRVALVSDNQLIDIFAKFFGYLLPGEVRVFDSMRLEEAKKWISEFQN